MICLLVDLIPNNTKPIIIVFNGTIEFNIEATELSISCSAKANKKAGKKLPTKAEIIIHFHCLKVISFNLLKVKGINAKAEIIILIEPSSIAVKPTNPFFIRMKELPQMNESAAR